MQETAPIIEPALSAPTSGHHLSHNEDQLSQEIKLLWSAHAKTKNETRQSRQELTKLRRELGKQLCQFKSLLVRTGRSGGWSAFLRDQNIPRTTAERYIEKHERLLQPSNCPSGTVTGLSTDSVAELIKKLRPRLIRHLTTPEAVYKFFTEIISEFPLATVEFTSRGFEVLQPENKDTSDDAHVPAEAMPKNV
jgi:hypothetical protein